MTSTQRLLNALKPFFHAANPWKDFVGNEETKIEIRLGDLREAAAAYAAGMEEIEREKL